MFEPKNTGKLEMNMAVIWMYTAILTLSISMDQLSLWTVLLRPGQTEKKALAMWASGFKFLLAHKKIHLPTSSSLVLSPFRVELA